MAILAWPLLRLLAWPLSGTLALLLAIAIPPQKSQNFANGMASTSSNATSVVTNVEMP